MQAMTRMKDDGALIVREFLSACNCLGGLSCGDSLHDRARLWLSQHSIFLHPTGFWHHGHRCSDVPCVPCFGREKRTEEAPHDDRD